MKVQYSNGIWQLCHNEDGSYYKAHITAHDIHSNPEVQNWIDTHADGVTIAMHSGYVEICDCRAQFTFLIDKVPVKIMLHATEPTLTELNAAWQAALVRTIARVVRHTRLHGCSTLLLAGAAWGKGTFYKKVGESLDLPTYMHGERVAGLRAVYVVDTKGATLELIMQAVDRAGLVGGVVCVLGDDRTPREGYDIIVE